MINKDKKKVLKYSIKKFSVGTFSVLVGAFIFLATPALANEINSSESIHKENSTVIEKEKTKEIYKSEEKRGNDIEESVSVLSKEGSLAEEKSFIEKTPDEKPKSRSKRSIESEKKLDKRFATDEDFEKFIQEWVIDVKDHEGYLAKLGLPRVSKLRVVPGFQYAAKLVKDGE